MQCIRHPWRDWPPLACLSALGVTGGPWRAFPEVIGSSWRDWRSLAMTGGPWRDWRPLA